jgi:AAA domain
MSAVDRILNRLVAVGFETRRGPVELLGETLPVIDAAAWDMTTAQFAVVGEVDNASSPEVWRQLLFAIAGLRHGLAVARSPALGPPLALLVVDETGEGTIRELVEELNQDFAIFTRLDLNLVRHSEVDDDEALDDALAPLLVRCRDALGETIAREDVQQFWGRLRKLIADQAAAQDDLFGGFRKAAGAAAADVLTGDLEDRSTLDPPTPFATLELTNFRSFLGQPPIAFAPVTVIHGVNGSGKSAVLEAAEICWARTTQRRPADVAATEFARHLAHEGDGEFEVAADGEVIREIVDQPVAELARCVLAQDTIGNLVAEPPEKRYGRLLTITGLELPEVDRRTKELVHDAKKEADASLVEAGLPPLRAITSNGTKHLETELRKGFVVRLPDPSELAGSEEVLKGATDGAYVPRGWGVGKDLRSMLEEVDEALATATLGADFDVSRFDEAAALARSAADERRGHGQALRLLAGAIRAARPVEAEADEVDPDEELLPAISRGLSARWLGHVRALESTAGSFRRDAKDLEDRIWSRRLRDYADALGAAVEEAPKEELEKIVGPREVKVPESVDDIDIPDSAYSRAGFSRPLGRPDEALEAIEATVRSLQLQTAELDSIATDLRQHPARDFGSHAERVLASVCRFELARHLRPRKGRVGPIEQASEEEVQGLLAGKLAPVVRELLAALVRFEWYFKPPLISGSDRRLVIGGIATGRGDLDARLTLNAAERVVFGLAWFLALYLLQPAQRRRVLVIDDASAAFDSSNQAAFVSTLRAFVRLVRPDQLIVVSHDQAVAESLADELAPVGDWPAAASLVRCMRSKDDTSVAERVGLEESPRDLQVDLEHLGVIGEMPTPA